ncbi:hypothetical protein Btru_020111 [Bulinus truncatus]|nr:hypothetical protein Btru_020111 [Bulinus truncatus]
MTEVNTRKSARKATKLVSYNDDDFELDLFDKGISPKTPRSVKNHRNVKRIPGEDKNLTPKIRHIKRTHKKDIVDENNHNISDSSEIENYNSKDVKRNISDHYQNGKTLTCGKCHIFFKSEQDLKAHLIEHNKDDKNLAECFICDICNRICMDEKSYNKHLKTHSGNRRFHCGICEKSFTESCSLKRHMKTHDDDRPFLCDLCFKSFRDSASLIRHQTIHTDRQKMFHCSKCEKSFMDKHGLKRHERIHTGLRPYKCKVCHKAFSDSGSLKRHQKIHSGVKDFSCPRCQKCFLEKQSLVRHQKNVCGLTEFVSFTEANSFDGERGSDSLCSAADHSEVSENSVDVKSSKTDSKLQSPKGMPTLVPSNMSDLPLLGDDDKKSYFDDKNLKDLPSLHSLIKKYPNLYNSISEIVESIDSYEKLLHLCGDRGQNEIDAALSRDCGPLPDGLICFECGETLVDGENFRREGKTLVASQNSLKCLNCEDDYDYGDPPLLTAEVTVDDTLADFSKNSEDKEQDLSSELQDKNSFIRSESIADLREHFKNKHSANFVAQDLDPRSNNILPVLISSELVEPKSVTKSNLPHIELPNTAIETCDLSFDKAGHLKCLSRDSDLSPSFSCHICSEVFNSPSALDQHSETHPRLPHKCLVCERTFTNSLSLKRHLTMHTGEKPYPCPHCGKCFRDPSNFSKHKKGLDCVSEYTQLKMGSSHKIMESQSGIVMLPVVQGCVTTSGTSCDAENHIQQFTKPNVDSGNHRFDFKNRLIKLPASESHAMGYFQKNLQSSKINQSDKSQKVVDETLNMLSTFEDIYENFNKGQARNHEEFDAANIVSNTDGEDLLVSCKVCKKGFKNEKFLQMHMSYHSANPIVTCIECGKSFSDAFSLKRHTRLHSGIRPHVCMYCNRGYCDNWSLKKHRTRGCMVGELKVSADFLHPCPQCTRVFSEVDFLQEHMKSHKGLLKFECDICMKRFSEAFNLKRHRRLHMATCSGCEQEFRDISSLTEHQKDCPANNRNAVNHGDGFPCPMCGRIYATKSYLERHKKFHSDLKPHVCEVCDKRFSEGFRLKRHMKIHSGTKPFTCEGCKKGFSDSVGLKRHKMSLACKQLKSHFQLSPQPETEYSCQICDKVFQKNYLLVRHMNVHSQERPFSCEVCGKSYKDTSSLKRHQLVHGGIKNFICSVCGKDFYYSDSLKRHRSGSCGRKSKSRRRAKSKFQKKSRKGSTAQKQNRRLNIKLEELISEENASNELDKNDVDKQVDFVNYPPSENGVTDESVSTHSAKQVNVSSLSHSKKSQNQPSKLEPHSKLYGHLKVARWQKKYKCTSCFLTFTQKIYFTLHNKKHY